MEGLQKEVESLKKDKGLAKKPTMNKESKTKYSILITHDSEIK